VLKTIANIFILIVGLLLIVIFWPVIKVEIKYGFDQMSHVRYSVDITEEGSFDKPLAVPDTDLSIVIPKIAAVAPIIENVDPLNKSEYLSALKSGVAHVKGTPLPGENGNVFIFTHSEDIFYNVTGYNTVFYLLDKLTKGDEIFIYYRGTKIKYLVDEVKVVNPKDIQYSTDNAEENTLTLQTLYPPGINFKRLLITAKQSSI
jgi:sortase A